jgi:hypothetical protein
MLNLKANGSLMDSVNEAQKLLDLPDSLNSRKANGAAIGPDPRFSQQARQIPREAKTLSAGTFPPL